MVNTKGLTRGAVLAVLYNASKPQGLGALHYNPAPMTEQEAEKLFAPDRVDDVGVPVAAFGRKSQYFDYLKGRVMKVDLSKPDGFEEWLYDRDNGSGAAQRAIDSLKTGAR